MIFIFLSLNFNGAAKQCGILPVVASVYDPLGFLLPHILTVKRVLQEMCRRSIGWTDPSHWIKVKEGAWIHDLKNLKNVQIPRCSNPENVRIITEIQEHCVLVIGKAQLTPTKVVTLPHVKLNMATVSAAISNMLREELDLKVDKEFFLGVFSSGYIENDDWRVPVSVVNRVQTIRDSTNPEQWFHIESKVNPADLASGGLTVTKLMESNWFTGPEFLWAQEITTTQSSL